MYCIFIRFYKLLVNAFKEKHKSHQILVNEKKKEFQPGNLRFGREKNWEKKTTNMYCLFMGFVKFLVNGFQKEK